MIDTLRFTIYLDNDLRGKISSQAKEKKEIQHTPRIVDEG